MKIVLLQVLRAFAALLVVTYHAQHEAAIIAERTGLAFHRSDLLPWAAGVDVFFVISGFIIVHASSPLYGRPGGRRRFLAHRVARLVPLYWIVTAAYLAIALARPGLLSGGTEAGPPSLGYVAASFLFFPASAPNGGPVPLYSLGWTLNCEMFFYALFTIGLGWGRRAAVAWLLASLGCLALTGLALPSLPMPLAFWTNPIILEFGFGAGLALARAEGLRLGLAWRSALAVLGLCGLAMVSAPSLALRPLFFGLPGLFLVAAAVLGEDATSARRGASHLPTGAAVALGDASYALYLTHPFVLRALREAILYLGLVPVFGPWGATAVMIGAAVLAALVVFRVIERPMTRAVRRWLDPGPKASIGKTREAGGTDVSRDVKRI